MAAHRPSRRAHLPHDAAGPRRYTTAVGKLTPHFRESLLALLVLALACLSFAHRPIAVAGPGISTLAASIDASYCGDKPQDDAGHAPCHACRLGHGADLPPPCQASTQAPRLALAVPPFAPEALRVATFLPGRSAARGPPLLA